MNKIILSCVFTCFALFSVEAQTYFSATPSSGCDPLDVQFTNLNPSNSYSPLMGQTTGFSYSWDFGNGQNANNENPGTITYNNPGSYEVIYECIVDTIGYILTQIDVTAIGASDPLGGKPDIYIVITDASGTEVVHTSYINDTDPPVSFSSLNLHLTNPPYFIRVWDYDSMDADDNCVDDSENLPGAATIIMLPANNPSNFGITTTNYTNQSLSFTAYYNKPVTYCRDTTTINVIASPLPPTLNYTNASFCTNEVISDIIANGNLIKWYSDSTLTNLIHTGDTLSPLNLSPGLYTYYVCNTDTGSCMSEAVKVNIEIFEEIDVTILSENVSCPGMNDGTASLTINQGQAPYTYLWSTGDSLSNISNLAAGEYDVTIFDANYCLTNKSFIIYEPDSIHVRANVTDVACDGSQPGSIELLPYGGTPPYSYDWENGNTTAESYNLESGYYTITITDNNSCEKDTIIYVGMTDDCLQIATVLTPNGDGKNDVWVIKAADNYPQMQVSVFDRTGILVFESLGYAEPWDGSYNGKKLPIGSYFFIIDLGNGTQQIKGIIDIIY